MQSLLVERPFNALAGSDFYDLSKNSASILMHTP
jgi:hypothetical protein